METTHQHPLVLPSGVARERLRAMVLIRAFEEHLLTLPQPGFQLLSTGEEAVAVGTCAPLGEGDQLLTSGRSVGPAAEG